MRLRRASHFTLAWPRESDQREGHPAWRTRDPGRAAGHRGPHYPERRDQQPDQEHPSPQPSPRQGRGEGANTSSSALRSLSQSRSGCVPSAGHDGPLLYRGPLCSGGRVEDQPAGWSAWMPTSLSSGQDALSTNPGAHTRISRAGCPRGAEAGVSFSLGYFSFGQEKEKFLALRRRTKALLHGGRWV